MRRNVRRNTDRLRGEGYVEYAIVLSVVMICSIVGLMTAGSETMKSLQYASGICDTCPKPKATPTGQGPGAPDGSAAPDGPTAPAPGDAPSAGPAEPPPSQPDTGLPPPVDPAYASGGGLPGDPNETMGVFAKIWGWFTGMFA